MITSAMGPRSLLVAIAIMACRADKAPPQDPYGVARNRMVDETIVARGVEDAAVIAALRRVPRHELVPVELRSHAYEDRPLPIGHEQTISQPYIVAAMTEAAAVSRGEKVLEIGTGSGYQAAVLAELGANVYSIEIVEPLAKQTHVLLRNMGYTRMNLRIGDGYQGWPEAAPFDAIIVTAAPAQIPQPLIDQLAVGGRLVIPVGERGSQDLRVITRGPNGTTSESLFPVRFVPMTGRAQEP